MNTPSQDALLGRRVDLPDHFAVPVIIEYLRPIGDKYECRVRLLDGTSDETILTHPEIELLLENSPETKATPTLSDPEELRLLIESTRIRLAYAHDRQFAVSLSGIRTLPHQIEAVYMKMLPQPRLRFLLADDPGAGKTIMAGLLIKEMKLRQAIDRILILCPAPLTIQWQDEMQRWFEERFEIINSAVDQQQLINPWHRATQVVTSIDYAKQDDVRERVWAERWDLIIIDEAHKCSAYTKRSTTRGDEADKTKRYVLAEKLANRSDHLLMLTATPHHGDDDRFAHFVRLIDQDLFPEPHKLGEKAGEIRRDVLSLAGDSPWALRRMKEDLKDVKGQRLFPDRTAHTVTFTLSQSEYELYKQVTAFINRYLPQASGKRKHSVALARTVFQRRLASSTRAIFLSIQRRFKRQRDLLEELETLPKDKLARRLALLHGWVPDAEVEDDDLDEESQDLFIDQFTLSVELDQLRSEIAALQDLTAQARRVTESAVDSKLTALQECLKKAEFQELTDGRGKLLIFTEHKDTLFYLLDKLEEWGFTTCAIYGGMNPHERKKTQEEFRTKKQICVATEAAGEGINLQFCHLMINYDMPWNPTRLEQRLGRIHRIGQERDVHVFNFVASDSEEGQPIIEGRILKRLLEKMEQMRAALADRVFDVIGEVLSLNDVNLPEMLRDVAFDPRRLDEYLDKIDRIDPQRLQQYEEATGVALARSSVDLSAFCQSNMEAEERRLMPSYVEDHFFKACRAVGLRFAARADGLWRIEHVLADLRSDRLSAIKRLGKPETTYRKITFHKQHLEQDKHLDATFMGPGHSLYAAVDERLNQILASLMGTVGVFVDEKSPVPYLLHFFEVTISGMSASGANQTLFANLVALRELLGETGDQRFKVLPADGLLELLGFPEAAPLPDTIDPKAAIDYLRTTYQLELKEEVQKDRLQHEGVVREYLSKSFRERIRVTERRVMELRARERESSDIRLARQSAERDLEDLKRIRTERMEGLNRLRIARPGPVRHIATAWVLSTNMSEAEAIRQLTEDLDPNIRQKSEIAAEDVVVAYEEKRGWTCERVGHLKIGFDIRSLGPADPETGYLDPVNSVRRIEVKGRKKGQPIRLTINEWFKAKQLGDSYWLYVVWNPLDNPDSEPVRIQNPVKLLDYAKKEVGGVRYYDFPAEAIQNASIA